MEYELKMRSLKCNPTLNSQGEVEFLPLKLFPPFYGNSPLFVASKFSKEESKDVEGRIFVI